jgi:hypothetical protein
VPLLGGSEVSKYNENTIFIDENTIFIDENTIFIDENTKNTYEIASFPIFSTLILSRLYLFSSMKIPRTHTKLLHFWFLCLIGHKITVSFVYSLLLLLFLLSSAAT